MSGPTSAPSGAAASAWHPDVEDERWLLEEIAARISISNHSTSARCWHPRSIWEPVVRRGLLSGVYVRSGARELAWAGGLRLRERWPDGYVAEVAVTPSDLRNLLMTATLSAAEVRGRAKVGYNIAPRDLQMSTKSGAERYPHRAIRKGPRTTIDGVDLGRSMLPNDIYVNLKRIADLDDDEILAAFEAGIAHLAGLPADAAPGERLGMSPAETEAAIDAAADVTRSRLMAWRKRHRQMTWDELRVLLRGLSSADAGQG